jgi:uncharacterized protein DUF3592
MGQSSDRGPKLSFTRRLAIMLGLLALYACLSFCVWWVIGGDMRALSKLRDRGRETTGIVRRIQTVPSPSVVVEYVADGEPRSVESRFVDRPNPRVSELRVGQSVTLWYLPEDPDSVSLGNPQRLMLRDHSVPISVSIGIALFFGAFWAWALVHPARQEF